ncbi:MAG: Lrp/AsnC family transcriptional regulator [Planctomycetota bacterium]|jgi:DNA-binding Lrp family transcriptional regulator
MSGVFSSEEERRKLLDVAQGELPVERGPFGIWAREIGLTETAVVQGLRELRREGTVRRFGGVFSSRAMGLTTTLVGAVVRAEKMEEALDWIRALEWATHVYVRDHEINVWFTLAASDEGEFDEVVRALLDRGLAEKAWSMPQKRLFKLKVNFPP